ncbi:MAG: metallophosphoesterase [Rhodocyclaceae bacterium]|nr:metallophosphoesterase [Rhodocyclaceae bacterium]MCP5232919.1 metallophosphoesterase [Zoogloeaceae bacterium]MCB1912888.1 metallophosphoesterase [Rhodocyclaceae bacterium]MCP5241669.1 metallophosphoesterase [Zoogloeaceae bacterium]MCP5255024.1 metallophosphoesterase [Zoogloeaceae bacterium]
MNDNRPRDSLRLIHLSDLHFGDQTQGSAAALKQAVRSLRPDLVVVTGDLSQRGRARELETARDFLDSFGVPWVATPGNHDLPRWPPWRRLIDPLQDFRRLVSSRPDSRVDADRMRLALIDSTNPAVWKAGRILPGTAREAAAYLAEGRSGQVRVVATHHPFDDKPGDKLGGMHGAAEALRILCTEGQVDLLLWGHRHQTEIGIVHQEGVRCVVGSGTSTPTSPRCEKKGESFHALELGEDAISIALWRRSPDTERFRRVSTRHFDRQRDNHWREVEPEFEEEEAV